MADQNEHEHRQASVSAWGREPALILGLLQAVLALAAAFALPLNAEQVGSIMAVAAAVLAVLLRTQVSPVARPAATDTQAGA